MIQLYDSKERCCGCTACMNSCSRHAIRMTADEEGFLYPKIDEKSCIECGACLKVCSFHKKEYDSKIPDNQEVYAMKHVDDKVRKVSTSGGAFTAISDYVLEHNGIVYGAIFADTFEVIHSKAINQDERDKMRGSKYVQSDLGTIYQEIKVNLNNGKLVLFTGTPCQNGGLKSYLGNKEYDNLILIDIVCHGVPSPKVWADYKKNLEMKYNDKINHVNFRNKDKGWTNSSLTIDFDHSKYQKSMQDDPFYILFFSHLIIRPSCHECVYATYHRVTDFSLADFWGIEYSAKSFCDNKGVSLLLVNTEKGQKILHSIQNNIDIIKSSHDEFYQPIFEAPSKISSMRPMFWQEYVQGNSNAVIAKYGRLTNSQKIVKKVVVPLLKITGLYKIVEKVYFRH